MYALKAELKALRDKIQAQIAAINVKIYGRDPDGLITLEQIAPETVTQLRQSGDFYRRGERLPVSAIPTEITTDVELLGATSGTGLNSSVRASTIINEVVAARDGATNLITNLGTFSKTEDLIDDINSLASGEIKKERIEGLSGKANQATILAEINASAEVTKINPAQIDTSSMAGFIPIGGMVDYFGAVAPTDWALLDGSEYAIATYPIAAVIFGGIGSPAPGNFCVPDLGGHVTVMYKSGDADFGTLNTKKGAKTHTLAETEIPSHTHNQAGSVSGTAPYFPPVLVKHDPTGTHAVYNSVVVPIGGATGAAGGGQAHNNIQPSYVVNKIVRLK